MNTFEYRMRPNKRQEQALMAVLIASRKLYNQGLEEMIAHYKETGTYLHLYEQDKRHGSKEHPDLPAVVVDTVLKRLHRSFTNFFHSRKVGFPRFKSANAWNTIQFRDKYNHLDGKYFVAPKHCGGRIRVIVHRPLEGKFKFARIVLRPSGWYLQCVCETEPHPLPKKDNAVGLDMGIRYLVADSNGQIIENPKHAKKSAKRLAKAQKRLSRCKKGSNRRKKAKHTVARHYERIANQRKDTLHKASHHYIKHYQTMVIEDLQPANMVQNHCLAFAIADASWGMLRHYLEGKAESASRQVIAVAPHCTSQKCSSCGEYVHKSLSVRTHVCPFCGYIADRDTNAARNILQRGLQVVARTEPASSGREGPEQSGESPSTLKREATGL
ncbi:MAG: IS200/IS605 family element transposase accessory protein TnpB [Chloroflexi bacterium]|nr:MAG: IS200/IS605 family element transposase accessory protein TnpB [Chloroflexota bacterium]